MIFSAKNEDGIPTWKLILEGKKTVTRRLKPLEPGKIRAVQPGRGKKSVGKIRVKECIPHYEWFQHMEDLIDEYDEEGWEKQLDIEANLEGFKSWHGLDRWFYRQKIDIDMTYRIEFERVDICQGCDNASEDGTICFEPCWPGAVVEESEVGVRSCSEFKVKGV